MFDQDSARKIKTKELKARYLKLQQELKDIASSKMGYPVSLMSSLYGDYTKEGLSITSALKGQKFIDNSYLGIEHGSLADIFIVNVGDPAKESLTARLEVKEFEQEIIQIFGKYLGHDPQDTAGYVASGGTEGNLACLWWSKLWIINKSANIINNLQAVIHDLCTNIKDITESNAKSVDANLLIRTQKNFYEAKQKLSEMLRPVVFYTKDHTHYSLLKAYSILGLEPRPIAADSTGAMDLDHFKSSVQDHIQNASDQGVIISANIYTTLTGAIDDVKEINNIAKSLLGGKLPYTIHADGSIGGIIMPITEPFGKEVNDYFDDLGINTISISTQKILGSIVSGIALTNRQFMNTAFSGHNTEIDYIGNIVDNTITCARSGLNILLIHNTLYSLGMDKDNYFIENIINHNLRNALYLYDKLVTVLGRSEVLLLPQRFNVVFTKPSQELMSKYQLMPAFEDKAVICVLQNITTSLIDQFIIDLKEDIKRV